jgi:hypothetical protein
VCATVRTVPSRARWWHPLSPTRCWWSFRSKTLWKGTAGLRFWVLGLGLRV